MPCNPVPPTPNPVNPSAATDQSYRYCRQVVRRAGSTFGFTFLLLPREKRRAMDALYAFFRVTDDIADAESSARERRERLAAWRASFSAALTEHRFDDPLLPALIDTIRRYAVPPMYLLELIDGVESDLDRSAVQTRDELLRYCYQVASVVGLACIHVWGFTPHRQALEAAAQCGYAFQLTNILRDVADDARRGRVYLPREELLRYGCDIEQVRRGEIDAPWRELLAYQIEQVERHYRRAAELVEWLHPDGRRIYRVMLSAYHALLHKIGRAEGDLFRRRIRLSKLQKIGAIARGLFFPPAMLRGSQ